MPAVCSAVFASPNQSLDPLLLLVELVLLDVELLDVELVLLDVELLVEVVGSGVRS